MMKKTMWFVAVLFACVWHEGNSRPSFSQLRSNYPRYQSIDWDGLVDQEGLDSWLKGVADKNTCAMRVSRALTHAGEEIVPGSCDWSGVRDRSNRPYIIRVATMRCYLENQYERPAVTESYESAYRGRQGIIVFENCPSFNTATGHVDLWDGYNCVGRCPGYFSACFDIMLFEFN